MHLTPQIFRLNWTFACYVDGINSPLTQRNSTFEYSLLITGTGDSVSNLDEDAISQIPTISCTEDARRVLHVDC